jgi:hypothetical protein
LAGLGAACFFGVGLPLAGAFFTIAPTGLDATLLVTFLAAFLMGAFFPVFAGLAFFEPLASCPLFPLATTFAFLVAGFTFPLADDLDFDVALRVAGTGLFLEIPRAGAAFFFLADAVVFFLAMGFNGVRLKVVRSIPCASRANGPARQGCVRDAYICGPLPGAVWDMAR